jgi:HSP20 family protein
MPKEEKDFYFPLRLPEELERLFDEIIHQPWGICRELLGWNPPIDLFETPEAFVLEADLPGVKEEDVKVAVEGDDLVLQGKRSFRQARNGGKFHCRERFFGEFVRRMRLPESVDKDKLNVEFSNGVLRVTLPKAKKRSKRS